MLLSSIVWWLVLAGGLLFVFLFACTRGALLVRALKGAPATPTAHLYPLYASASLMRLIDFSPLIRGLLLFQYDAIVQALCARLAQTPLPAQTVLVTSCAYGDLIPKVAATAAQAGELVLLDIVPHQLHHAQRKLQGVQLPVRLLQADACTSGVRDHSVSANVIFFLLHELPAPLQRQVLHEAVRVLQPGATLLLAEFHRPHARLMRVMSWLYFKTFEPHGLNLWQAQDPMAILTTLGCQCERQTFCAGNFQLIAASRPLH